MGSQVPREQKEVGPKRPRKTCEWPHETLNNREFILTKKLFVIINSPLFYGIYRKFPFVGKQQQPTRYKKAISSAALVEATSGGLNPNPKGGFVNGGS